MKKLLVLSCVSVLFVAAFAQKGARMNFGAEVALPVQSGLNVGYNIHDQLIFNPLNTKGQTFIVLNTSSFSTKGIAAIDRYTTIALRGGYRILPAKTRFYIDAEAGAGLLWASWKVGDKMESDKNIGFSYSAGTGYFLKENGRLALSLRYTGIAGKANIGWIGIGLSIAITRH